MPVSVPAHRDPAQPQDPSSVHLPISPSLEPVAGSRRDFSTRKLWISTRWAGRGRRRDGGGRHKWRSFQFPNVKKDSCNSDKKNNSSLFLFPTR
uniref:Uncharacterized protein n=1 Tax=Arundo donax TaxID=35708 RepID=A0A0A9ETF6_ARUDO